MVTHKASQKWFYGVSLIWGGIGLVCIVPALFFVAFYDSPSKLGSVDYLAILSAISFPVVCLVSSIAILVLGKIHRKLAVYVSLLPILPLVAFFSILFLRNLFSCGSLSCDTSSTLRGHGKATPIANCAPPILDMEDGLDTTGCGTLEPAMIGTGKTRGTSEAHSWRFSTQNRVQLTLVLENDGKSCPQIRIFDSSGKMVEGFEDRNRVSFCAGGMISTGYYKFQPPADGIYIVRVVTPQSPGAYWLRIE